MLFFLKTDYSEPDSIPCTDIFITFEDSFFKDWHMLPCDFVEFYYIMLVLFCFMLNALSFTNEFLVSWYVSSSFITALH
jgi:hypothetical protein